MNKLHKREASASKYRSKSARVAARDSFRPQQRTKNQNQILNDDFVTTIKETSNKKIRNIGRTKASNANITTTSDSQGSKEILLKRDYSDEHTKLMRKKWQRSIQLTMRNNRKKRFEKVNEKGIQSIRNLKLSVDNERGSVDKDSTSVTSMNEGIIQRRISKESNENIEYNRFKNNNSYIRSAIPCLPLSAAIICFIFNMLIPGTGTLLSGILILCVGETRLDSKGENQRLPTLLVNFTIGICQMLTIVLLLVGWFWSIAWGFYMIIISLEKKRELDALLERQRSDELKLKSIKALGLSKNTDKIY
jgi:hypothetical protein